MANKIKVSYRGNANIKIKQINRKFASATPKSKKA